MSEKRGRKFTRWDREWKPDDDDDHDYQYKNGYWTRLEEPTEEDDQ